MCSENEIERMKGIERIIQIRQNQCKGNLVAKTVRIRQTPKFNSTATNLNEVIAWKNAFMNLCVLVIDHSSFKILPFLASCPA